MARALAAVAAATPGGAATSQAPDDVFEHLLTLGKCAETADPERDLAVERLRGAVYVCGGPLGLHGGHGVSRVPRGVYSLTVAPAVFGTRGPSPPLGVCHNRMCVCFNVGAGLREAAFTLAEAIYAGSSLQRALRKVFWAAAASCTLEQLQVAPGAEAASTVGVAWDALERRLLR